MSVFLYCVKILSSMNIRFIKQKSWELPAILLICAILDDETLKRFFTLAEKLGLSCLVEAHDENEIKRALKICKRELSV